MQWRKMNRRAQLIQHVWCDDLMLVEVRTTVNHAVPDRDWRIVDMLSYRGHQRA